MYVNGLSAEQKARVCACRTPEEMLAFAREEGYDLSDAELRAASNAEDSWSPCEKDTNSGPY